jgi:nitrate reductase NapE component
MMSSTPSNIEKELTTRVYDLEQRLKRSEMITKLALCLGIFATLFVTLRPFATAFSTLVGWR